MEIGENCSYRLCNRLDFLPFTCNFCHKVFCKEHSLPEQHNCENKPTAAQNAVTDEVGTGLGVRSFSCSYGDCKRRELVEVRCPDCNGVFCLGHRHQVEHRCPRQLVGSSGGPSLHGGLLRLKESAESNQNQVAKPIKSGSSAKDARMESTRAKVLMMKLKLKAEGLDAIPLSERVYYEVILPDCHGETASKAMFFSKEWSIGKVVDFIATKHKLVNENNRLHSKKLMLHDVNGVAMEMSQPLNSLLDYLPSGATLVLQYIP